MAWDEASRRAQRAEKEKLRKAKQKKHIAIFTAVAVLAVAVIIAVALLSRCSGPAGTVPTNPTEPSQPVATQPNVEAPTQPTEPPKEDTVIRFLAAGDLNITENVVASGGDNYDFTRSFLDVSPILAGADLTSINLEGVLCGAPYGASGSAPIELAHALKRSGVDILQLANSYAMHRGVSGLRTTIDAARAAGLEPVGVSRTPAEFQEKGGFTIFEVKGVRIAVVSFTKGMLDGTALPPGTENMVNVLYTDYDSTYQKVATAKITAILEAAQAQKPDITIALLHWGSEYNDNISKTQKTIANLMLQNGVDAIIGTHPHRVQQIQYDPENHTLVAYSLGDFFGDVPRSGSEYSILLELEITKRTDGTTLLTGYDYIPIFTQIEEGMQPRVLRIREAMAAYESGYVDRVSEQTYEAMKYALTRITARITPPEEE